MAGNDDLQGTLNFQVASENLRPHAERAVRAAEALARASDPSSEAAFAAFEDAERLTDRAADPELQMHLQERFGLFLLGRGAFSRAREHFLKGERTAEFLDLDESAARLQVRIAETEISLVGDEGKKSFFENFKQAANGSYSWQDRRDVWFGFIDDVNASRGRLAVRKFGSKEDFGSRLDAVRRGRR